MKNKKEETYQLIKNNIIYGRYVPGERLLEAELVDTYNSSRLHIREFLRRLNDEGLVELTPYKGASISKMSLQEVVNSYGLLEMLESYAVEIALPSLPKSSIRKLEKINNNLEKYIEDKDITNYIKENLNFHLFLSKLSKNDLLVNIVTNLRHRNLKYSYFVLAFSIYADKFLEQHKTIIKTCYDKDGALIKKSIREHISFVKLNVIKNYQQKFS